MNVAAAESRVMRPAPAGPRELVVCSLEAWDDVWRRNQFLTDELLRANPGLRVLFVEPPVDPLFALTRMRRPARPRSSSLRSDGRLRALRPIKPLPRRCGPLSDRWLHRRVLLAARRFGFSRPTLWLNDVNYAPLISLTGWPAVYDVTDDWLLAPGAPHEIARLGALDALALTDADEVVVCSSALSASRGRDRVVTLIPNGVDTDHFRRAQSRPVDLPAGLTAVYVGTLHESRLDVDLVIAVARGLAELSLALVGPDALSTHNRRRLASEPNVSLLGSRPYAVIPAYLQHADVVLVPHLVTPFTDSLDPIKAHECLAVDTPTVATPVSGFRELSDSVTVVSRDSFVAAVRATLASPPERPDKSPSPSWADRARAFAAVLDRAGGRAVVDSSV